LERRCELPAPEKRILAFIKEDQGSFPPEFLALTSYLPNPLPGKNNSELKFFLTIFSTAG